MKVAIEDIDASKVIFDYYAKDVKLVRGQKSGLLQNKSNNHPVRRCWWCRGKIEGTECIIPTLYVPPSTFEGTGQFDCMQCALAYNLDRQLLEPEFKDADTLLALYMSKMGFDLGTKPAASWKLLKEFGGELTPEELKNTSVIKLPTVGKMVMHRSIEKYLVINDR